MKKMHPTSRPAGYKHVRAIGDDVQSLNKIEIPKNKNFQNFQFPSAGTTFPSAGATFPSAGTENAIPKRQLPQARYFLDCPFQKLGGRMDAPISTPGIDFNERFSAFKK